MKLTVPLNVLSGLRSTWKTDGSPEQTYADSFVDYTYVGLDKSGVDLPSWRDRVLKGYDASTRYSRVSLEYDPVVHRNSVGGIATFEPRTNFVTKSIGRAALSDLPNFFQTGDDPALMSRAAEMLQKRIRQDSGQSQLLVPLVELREMRGLIRTLAGSGSGLVKALLDIRRTRGVSAYKYASDAWLTWSFGISPMLGDVKSIAESLASLSESPVVGRYVGHAEKDWTSGFKRTSGAGLHASLYGDVHLSHNLSYRYIAAQRRDLSTANNYVIAQQFGLEAGALPSVLWELTPYSWLVDYFTNVGAYMEEVFTSPPGSTIYVVQNKRYTCDVQHCGEVKNSGSYDWLNFQLVLPGSATYSNFSRTPLAQLPTPSLRFKSVDEIGRNAVNRLLNLSALLAPSGALWHYQRPG